MTVDKRSFSKNSILKKEYRVQLLASLTAHLMTFSHGIGLGWLSPALQLMQSTDSPLSFTVDIEQASWIGSLYGLGSLTGNILFGILLDRIGRKRCMYLIALPHILLWILIFCSYSVEYLYVARFMGGLTGGANYVVAPIFVGEIADINVRGALSSLAMMSVCFGILVGFILGSQLGYFLMPCIIISLPIIFIICLCFLHETPQFLLKNGHEFEAEKSFRFYKRLENESTTSIETQTMQIEFNEMKRIMLKGNFNTKLTPKDFLNKTALGAFCTAFVVLIVNQFSGSFAFINYMAYIFTESGVTMDPNVATIIVGVVETLGTVVASFIVDRFGRRILMLTSAGGVGIGLAIFGLFTKFATAETKVNLSWLPVLLMNCIIFMVGFGIVGLVFTVIVEIYPTKIRSAATAICMGFFSCLIFVALKVYPILINDLGISTTMFISAGVCFFSFVYLAIFMPETNGKSLNFD